MDRPSAMISRLTATLLAESPTAPPVRLAGHGNENWLVELHGWAVLIKIAQPGHPVAKAESASRAQALAHAGGVPVARELLLDTRCAAVQGRTVRILEYLPGQHPSSVLDSPTGATAFFDGLGRAVAQLHLLRCAAFASRVGGDPSFSTWQQYVGYRVPQIARRAEGCPLFTDHDLTVLLGRALELAEEVSVVVEPRLTHRDLHLDNLLARPGGTLSALLDLDLAEPWDPVADFVKLRWQIFSRSPGSAGTFWSSYSAVGEDLPRFAERLRLAQIIELTNIVVNAEAAGDDDYAREARHKLDQARR